MCRRDVVLRRDGRLRMHRGAVANGCVCPASGYAPEQAEQQLADQVEATERESVTHSYGGNDPPTLSLGPAESALELAGLRVKLEITPAQCSSLDVAIGFALHDAAERPARWPDAVVADLRALQAAIRSFIVAGAAHVHAARCELAR